jgi:hypothetical protein
LLGGAVGLPAVGPQRLEPRPGAAETRPCE